MKNQTILVVGGAGFIGSHMNKMLHQAGYQTIVFDNLYRGNRATIQQGTFIEGELGNRQALEAVFQQYPIDAVMHFAALIDVGESVQKPAKYYLNNVCYTLNLLEVMLKHDVKFFIFSSSAAIFGYPLQEHISEDHPCRPINPYGESKWMVEKILRDFDQAYGLKSCCLRYFNAAGGDPEGKIKNYQTDVTNLIPLTLRRLQKDQPIIIFGTDYPTPDGTCIRDYIHIEDLGQAHLLGMEALFQARASMAYNLGNGQGYSVREVIQAIETVTKRKVKTIEGDRRPGDPPILVADASKISRELDWKPHYVKLEEMIKHAWMAINP